MGRVGAARCVGGVVAQRRLMDGGSCEATVFCAAGLAAGGVALPLAGYHNQPDDESVSGPVAESVAIVDYESEVALLTALCEEPPSLVADSGGMFERIAAPADETLRRFPL